MRREVGVGATKARDEQPEDGVRGDARRNGDAAEEAPAGRDASNDRRGGGGDAAIDAEERSGGVGHPGMLPADPGQTVYRDVAEGDRARGHSSAKRVDATRKYRDVGRPGLGAAGQSPATRPRSSLRQAPRAGR